MNLKKVFAKGLCKTKLFWMFVIGSVFGCYYEQILNFVKVYLSEGNFFWETRRGVLYTPISPIYGAGAVLMVYFLVHKKMSNVKTFIYGSLIGGTFEYLISFLQETFVGTVSWDYSNHLLNIDGRTTIPFMIIWGLLALFLSNYLYPFISNVIEKIPYEIGSSITVIIVIILGLDMFISWTALIRQTLRRNNVEPISFLGEIYDKVYPDDVLKKHFPNMQVKE